MPYLNLKLSATPSVELTARIAARLTELTAMCLRKKRELTAVAVEYVPPSQWFIGGEALEKTGAATFYLDIKVTEGTNTKDEKADFIRQVFSEAGSLLGLLHPTSYIVIHDVSGDAWGYHGKTQEFRYIQGKAL